jgi:hypothetical protein
MGNGVCVCRSIELRQVLEISKLRSIFAYIKQSVLTGGERTCLFSRISYGEKISEKLNCSTWRSSSSQNKNKIKSPTFCVHSLVASV